MAAHKHSAHEARSEARAARDLSENGREEYAWRVVDGEAKLVVVGLGFTIPALDYEDFQAFKQRMLNFASRLAALQYPVKRMTFHRREAQGKLPWCEFDCETPETRLPRTED